MEKKRIRILNVSLNGNKKRFISLKKIKGLGENRIKLILEKRFINKNKKLNLLKKEEILRLIKIINYYRLIKKWNLGINVDRIRFRNIRLLINLKNYRGLRHEFRLPVRGQRTRSNRKTIKKIKNFK
jgi:small subunit ribosomal protein S13